MADVDLIKLKEELEAVYDKHGGGRVDLMVGMLLGQAIRFADMMAAAKASQGDGEEKISRDELLNLVGAIFDQVRETEEKRGG